MTEDDRNRYEPHAGVRGGISSPGSAGSEDESADMSSGAGTETGRVGDEDAGTDSQSEGSGRDEGQSEGGGSGSTGSAQDWDVRGGGGGGEVF